jgi:transposase|tara:strand:- start:880 stop:1329 length:450 start_codon:yes stop_codon:yes gene_type:complete
LPKKTHIVSLTSEERDQLRDLIRKGKAAAYKQRHARILLKTDQGPHGEHWNDEQVHRALDVHVSTVERLRKRFVEEGFEAALNRKVQKNRMAKKIDGRAEAHLVALACGKPPDGRNRWTLKLLADRLVALELVDSVCPETVRQTLKKTR